MVLSQGGGAVGQCRQGRTRSRGCEAGTVREAGTRTVYTLGGQLRQCDWVGVDGEGARCKAKGKEYYSRDEFV